jgi:hypothetical protein
VSTISEVNPGEEMPPAAEQPEPPPNPPAAKPPGGLRRLVDWFWCGSAFRALRASRQLPSARTLELSRRARAALELSQLALEPTRTVEHGSYDALACDLSSQSVYWTLLARESLAAAPQSWITGATSESLESLWRRADVTELARAAGNAESAAAIGQMLIGRNFVDFAELPADEQARLASSARPFAEALLEGVDSAERSLEKLWFRRLFRVSIPVVAIALALVGVFYGLDRLEQARDIARQKPWTASSRWPEGGCLSPAQECPGSPMYFFSTTEEDSPWLEIDLGAVQPVSAFRVSNRKDCCLERAIPLVIEVSVDHTHFKEVARRTEDFSTWKGSFPSTNARWVRLRVARRSFLHLSSVRLFK